VLNKTRVSGKMDVGRLGAAISRPGIDTRVWVSLAVATGESVVDPQNQGVFVDIMLLPTGERCTARVPSTYAGVGFGLYAKIHADDEVLVCIPSGDVAEGAVVVSRLWSASDPPPQQAQTTPDDLVLVVEQDKNLDVLPQGGGLINLGSATPQEFVALAQKVLTELQRIQSYMNLVDTVLRGPPAVQPPGAPDVLWVALNAAIAATPYPAPQAVAATKVKAL
jgi:hypothetical protein